MSKAQAARTFFREPLLGQTIRKQGRPGENLWSQRRDPDLFPKLDEKARKLLEDDLKERPCLTLQDRCEYIEVMTGTLGKSLDHVPCHSEARPYP